MTTAVSNLSRSNTRKLNLKTALVILSFLTLLVTLTTVLALVDLYVISNKSNNNISSRIILTKSSAQINFDNHDKNNVTINRHAEQVANVKTINNSTSLNDSIINKTFMEEENLNYILKNIKKYYYLLIIFLPILTIMHN